MAKNKKSSKKTNPNRLIEHFLTPVVIKSFKPMLLDNFALRSEDAEEGGNRAGEIRARMLKKSKFVAFDDTEYFKKNIPDPAFTIDFTTYLLFTPEVLNSLYSDEDAAITEAIGATELPNDYNEPEKDDTSNKDADDEEDDTIYSRKGDAIRDKINLMKLKKDLKMTSSAEINRLIQKSGFFVGTGGTTSQSSEEGILINPNRVNFIFRAVLKEIYKGEIKKPIAAKFLLEVRVDSQKGPNGRSVITEWDDDKFKDLAKKFAIAFENILLQKRKYFDFVSKPPAGTTILPATYLALDAAPESSGMSTYSVGKIPGDEFGDVGGEYNS